MASDYEAKFHKMLDKRGRELEKVKVQQWKAIPEYTVHKNVTDWLALVLDGFYHTTEVSNQQGGERGAAKQAKDKRRGVKAGFPDILILSKGKLLFLEVKRWGKEAEKHQVAIHNELYKHGAPTEVVHNVDEARQALRKHNIPTREVI